jgi:hypothetical protein
MTPLDCPFDAWNEDDAAGGCESPIRCRIELFIVKGDCKGIEPELSSAVNQFMRRVDNAIRGVVRTMGMKVNFHHRSARNFTLFHKSCLSGQAIRQRL